MEVEAKVMGVDFEKTKGEKDEENREEKWWKHSIKVKGGGIKLGSSERGSWDFDGQASQRDAMLFWVREVPT